MRLFAVLAAVALGVGTGVGNAAPASAHGALTTPISRTAACGEVGTPDAPVCRAARAGGPPLDWSNLRLPNVNGRDRDVVPDGKLCSAGKQEFAGLDLVRGDWPVTRLSSGTRMTFRYGETIPHKGTFRLYVTKDGYDPARQLRWSDLETKPFASVTDPPLRDEAYTFSATVPPKSGRHLIYTIWQNSSTPDTYYSCSDVYLATKSTDSGGVRAPRASAQPAPPAPPAAPAAPSASPAPAPSDQRSPSAGAAPSTPGLPAASTPDLARAAQPTERSFGLPLIIGGVFAAFALAGGVAVLLLRRRAPRQRRGRH